MKHTKAIDLVWKAQPMAACLKEIALSAGNVKFAEQIGEWQDAANELLNRKAKRKGEEE